MGLLDQTNIRLPGFRRRDVLKAAVLAPLGAAVPWNRLAQAHATVAALDPLPLGRAMARAARLDQLHGLIIGLNGEVAVGEAFRGPKLDRSVNVKSVSKTIVASLAGAALDRGVLRSVTSRSRN